MGGGSHKRLGRISRPSLLLPGTTGAGDEGGGDRFASVQKPERPGILVREHESDSRRWVADNLQDHLGRALRVGDDWYQL